MLFKRRILKNTKNCRQFKIVEYILSLAIRKICG